ncbi:MAG: ferritin-like domain-containing protein [Erysipelotrichaceae bacterium]
MGKASISIAHLDTDELIDLLNMALAEEWLSYYQYWIGARVMEGPMRMEIEEELLEHANEELGHAELLATRITQLGGTPILSPDEWSKVAGCAYQTPSDPYTETILTQNLGSERCAIERYQQIASLTEGKDYATYQIAINILNDELDHEEDIEGWMKDISSLKNHLRK